MVVIIIILLFLLIFLLIKIRRRNNSKTNTLISKEQNINEWSFQRYAKFYGNMVLKDEYFEEKMNTICDLVLNKKIDDINFIAKESKCTYDECILKIRYLKNKRKIEDLYIDNVNKLLKKCSLKEQKLLDKYSTYLYKHHLQINEIALKMPHTSSLNFKDVEQEVFNDIVFLDEKGLINGIILNKVDKKIIYYSVEKHKNGDDFITINCPNCGALNDLNKKSKVRCEYCDTIISYNDINN